MSPQVEELFERWRELYESLELLGSELGIPDCYVMGDHDLTPYIYAVCPEVHARALADAICSRLGSVHRYSDFEFQVHGVKQSGEPGLSLRIANATVTEQDIEI